MDALNGFKMPSVIAQDIALIMGYVDPPTPMHLPETGKRTSVEKNLANPIVEPETTDKKFPEQEQEEDINSSGPESEAGEVENELLGDESTKDTKEEDVVAKEESDSDSTSSDSSSSDLLDSDAEDEKMNGSKKPKPHKADPVQLDLDEEGPSVPNDYIPTEHEVPLTSIPIPPLPDPATLPSEPLEFVGEIGTVLNDTIIIRGGGSGSSAVTGYTTGTEKRHGVLDEGSLLLFDDRTPLGYVWETFGPTHLPHYIVRIPRRTKEVPKEKDEMETDRSMEASNNNALLDKATLSRPIYHLRSTSKFVFTAALTKFKGSDASNIHDEELPEHEQEFSDDEAEAAFKRARRKGSRAPSVPRSQHYDSSTSTDPYYMEDAGSLYGDSPYDIEGSNPSFRHQASSRGINSTQIYQTTSSLHRNPEIQEALLKARMSRPRRQQSGPSDVSPSSQFPNPPSRSFSFEEYDPRMPRPPSPTSLAIAQATGQWSNGIPFACGSNTPLPSYAPPGGYTTYHHSSTYASVSTNINPQFVPPYPDTNNPENDAPGQS